MPLFFIVSGILMKDASAKVITVKILKRLLIPYVIIVSICFFLGFSIRLIVDDESVNCNMIKQQLIGVLTASDFKYHDNFSGAMWFCVALAWIQFFFAVTNRYLRLCAIMGGGNSYVYRKYIAIKI
jgi:fucose 4-O-acetylase-like acetyltransferase